MARGLHSKGCAAEPHPVPAWPPFPLILVIPLEAKGWAGVPLGKALLLQIRCCDLKNKVANLLECELSVK